MAPATPADLIFSDQANHNFSKTLGELKRFNLSISNRLNSIIEDASFVQRVKAAWQRPLIANERCGSWYIEPTSKDGSAYFKSTDGHNGVWKFSTRRLNLHILSAIGNKDGCIIVDSTRKGKKMPDALSKTIPIWCAVLNRALFPEKPEYHNLYTPPQVISHTEHSQISKLLDSFLKSFLDLYCDVTELRGRISKPLRPLWVTPDTQFADGALTFSDYHSIICCTASRQVQSGETSESSYVQGSGDDTENWAHGLTPPVFWGNAKLLLTTSEADLPDKIAELAGVGKVSTMPGKMSSIRPTSSIYITTVSTLQAQPPGLRRIIISTTPEVSDSNTWKTSSTEFNVGLGPHKLGSRNLRTVLPHIINFVTLCLTNDGWKEEPEDVSIILACSTGKDHSVGIALALLCLFIDDRGALKDANALQPKRDIDKDFIRRRLSWIMTAMPEANPSRATLQSVNSYLMERP